VGTQANTYIDVVFEAIPDRSTFESAMNDEEWSAWSDGLEIDGPKIGFRDDRAVHKWQGGLCYVRFTRSEWDALKIGGLPVSMVVLSEKDPWAQSSPQVDPDNPTDAELYGYRNVWYDISQDVIKTNRVRTIRPEQVPERDDNGNPTARQIKQGLAFGSFDENARDFRGKNESPAVGM
jgi:hypothetical protein